MHPHASSCQPMCGRMTLTTGMNILKKRFHATYEGDFHLPRYNIAPGQNILALLNTAPQTIREIKWGFSPHWAKNLIINIRAENLRENMTFNRLLENNRCLILADGFYEWKQEKGTKEPSYISLKTKEPFAFAGLWQEKPGKIVECSIITVAPNDLMSGIHHRMPAILQASWENQWIDSSFTHGESLHFLQSYPSEEMTVKTVSRRVNSAMYDGPELITPVSKAGPS